MSARTSSASDVLQNEKNLYAELMAVQHEHPELALSGATSIFSLAQVKFAQDRIAATGMVSRIAAWRAEDVEAAALIEGKRHAGGRPRTVHFTDEHILIGLLLLAREHSPMFTKALSNLFRLRLSDEARTYLDLDHMATTGDELSQTETWYTRTDRALHDLIDTMDAYPAKRQIGNRA